MLHALNHALQWLLVFGTVSSLHLISFLHLFHSFFPNREHRGLPSLALRMVFLPSTDGYTCISGSSTYRKHEAEKKRKYGQRVRDVENASFTPLVFSTTGGMSKETTVFLKRLASLISSKRNTSYADTIGLIRCRLCFALLCSAIMCLRGTRSHLHHSVKRIESVDLVRAESRLSP